MNSLCFQLCEQKLPFTKKIFTRYNLSFISIHYLRFGDMFLIGIQGPLGLIFEIEKKIINYLQNDLYIHEKSIILDIKHLAKGISFLGYL